MGNAATKESRTPCGPPLRHGHSRGASTASNQERPRYTEFPHPSGSSRNLRGSRPDLSFLGMSSAPDRDSTAPEHRRETKQEREARKREKEHAARLKERERSMKEEHVDGGYLVTQGVYVGTEDFSKPIVRQLMIERRLAPFWRGLNDFSDSWAEHQLMAAARGLPIPAPDEIPPELQYKPTPTTSAERQATEKNLDSLTVPITSRSQSFNSDSSSAIRPDTSSSPISGHLFRGRAKTLATLTASKGNAADMAPREFQLPKDPFVNGQPIEAYLYKDASECPICFLYYPPYLNKTRCCDQPICSECFVQIKRPDPHPPEHDNPDPNAPATPENRPEELGLVTEPAACPFCVQPEFGATYSPPPFRRGLTHSPGHGLNPHVNGSSPSSSSSSLVPGAITRRRATSLSADAPNVITTDRIRPDWASKLAAARAQAARRSAAATALHTAAYMMNSSGNGAESRNLSNIGRRSMLRRATGQDSPGGRNTPPNVNAIAYLAERRAILERGNESPNDSSTNLAPPRASSRRNRIEELEQMMMEEAIRLSLAAEEDRRRKEEKDAKKEAKRRGKEAKKAEKHAKKVGLHSKNASSLALDALPNATGAKGTDTATTAAEDTTSGKGKEVDRSGSSDGPSTGEPGPSNMPLRGKEDVPLPLLDDPIRTSHLRQLSSASSSNSSLVESTFGEQIGSGTPHDGSSTTLAPVLGFRSLAAMIDDDDEVQNHLSAEPGDSTTEIVTDEQPAESNPVNGSPVEKAEGILEDISFTQPHRTFDSKDSSISGKEAYAHSAEILQTETAI